MNRFKFFSGKKSNTDWGATGLLIDAINENLLIEVLNQTRNHMVNNSLYQPSDSMLFVIMTKLFRDKLTDYSPNFIQYKIDESIIMMRSPEISNYILEIQQNAWSGVDVEAEMVQIIYERLNWVEE